MTCTNSYIQEARTGVLSSDIEVYIASHKGLDSSNPELLGSQSSTDRLVKCLLSSLSLHCFSISNLHGLLVPQTQYG